MDRECFEESSGQPNHEHANVVQGADWFESALVDYDVCSNWGNWVAAAGLTGGRINHFNITKQSKVRPPAHAACSLASHGAVSSVSYCCALHNLHGGLQP
jgi:hypothetical protein